MKISVVTVTYNCAETVEETIRSVLHQDYSDIDYVVVDGCSEDGTLDIIKKYRTCIATLLVEPDKGIFDAMNKSLQYVKGEYVLFMNAGDKFVSNDVVSRVFQNQQHDEDLIYGDTYNQTEFGFRLRGADDIYSHNPSNHDLVFKSQGFCHQSLFTKTDVLRCVRFDLSYPVGADYNTTAKVYYHGNRKILNVGFPISIFDDRRGGFSHYKEVKMYKERFVMFDYKPDLKDWFVIYKQMYISIIKRRLEECLPNYIKKYRARKYEKSVKKC